MAVVVLVLVAVVEHLRTGVPVDEMGAVIWR